MFRYFTTWLIRRNDIAVGITRMSTDSAHHEWRVIIRLTSDFNIKTH